MDTQVVMTNSFRGGTGKSTVVSNLGTYLAIFGMKVVIIDADIQSPGIHAIFGMDEKSFDDTFTDYLLGKTKIEDTTYDISDSIELPDNSLFLVPSSIGKGDLAELLGTKKTKNSLMKAVEKIKDIHAPDFILIDTHPGINEDILVATSFADVFLNIVRPDNQDYQGAEVTSNISKELNINMHIVLNKVHRKINEKEIQKKISKAFGVPVAGAIPFSEDVLMSESRYIYAKQDPKSKFTVEIQKIAAKVLDVVPRDHIDIMHAILEDLQKAHHEDKELLKKHTHLPKKDLDEYLERLKAEKFIKEVTTKKPNCVSCTYEITKKGKDFLKRYKSIRKFIKNFRI